MEMSGSFEVESPEEVRITLTASMTVVEWEGLAAALEHGSGSIAHSLGSYIRQMVERVKGMVIGATTFKGQWNKLEGRDA